MSLKEKLLKSFNDQRTADITIRILPYALALDQTSVCPILEFHCHRLLLCQHHYWEKMLLSQNYKEQQDRLISLSWFDSNWMNPKCFRIFFQCFYVDKEYFASLGVDKYLRELHYFAASINFVPLMTYCETKLIATLTLQTVCDLIRYTTFVFPDYSQARPESLPTPWSSSMLYHAILRWISVFYPIDYKNEVRATVKELMHNNCSLLKHLFQSPSALFRSRHERLQHLRKIIEEMAMDKQPPMYDLYNHVNVSFMRDDEASVSRSCIYYLMDAYDNPRGARNKQTNDVQLTKDVKMNDLTFRYTYLSKEKEAPGSYDCIAIYVFKDHRSMPPRQKIKFHVTIGFINTKETSTLEYVAVISIGSRCDIPDKKNQFLAHPFILDDKQNKLAAAYIELKFIGYS